MNTTLFFIIITLSVIGIAAMLIIEFPICRRVKAGTANKFVFGKAIVRRLDRELKSGIGIVKVHDYKQMVVAGNSMKDYDIHDGDIVLVKTYDDQSKKEIHTHPVIAIKLSGQRNPLDSDMKLRKFVGYATDQKWGALYDRYSDRVKQGVSRDDFIASCSKSYDKKPFAIEQNNPAVISETYDVDSHRYHYSVHPVNLLYGKVMYVSS